MKQIIFNYRVFLIISIFITSSCSDDNIQPPPSPINIPNAISFNPNIKYDSVVDIDGNIYKTVIIGKHTWMAENLRVTKFRNGDKIPYLKNNWEKGDLMGGAGNLGFCVYDNIINKDSIAKYGLIYGVSAIEDIRIIAPLGWHVATYIEWRELYTDSLLSYRGVDWVTSIEINKTDINNTGLTLLPAGLRNTDGSYAGRGDSFIGYSSYAIFYFTKNEVWEAVRTGQVARYSNIGYLGHSIRCVKDE